jgi:peptidoglycan/LPS O-acetylase OafA/YrhL
LDQAAAPASGQRGAERAPAGRIDQIDSLRALAMTAVIAEHCHILPFGWMGVWLFFVISGFVVTTSLLSRPINETSSTRLTQFYTRRAARIWPIYLAYVTIGFVASALAVHYFNWPAFVSFVLFYNNFQLAFADGLFKAFPVGHLWTISVEFQFYIVFGLAFTFLSRRALTGLLLVFLVLSPVLRFIGGEWLHAAGYTPLKAAFAIYSFSPMHFDSFAAGALLALGRERWARASGARALLIAGLGVMIAYIGVYVGVNHAHGATGVRMLRNIISGILYGDFRQVWLYSAVALLSAGLIATILAGKAAWVGFTRNGLLQAIGRVSYGGYVYHALCVRWVGELMRLVIPPATTMASKLEFGAAQFAVALSATIAVALLSYHWVEQPIILAVGRRLAPPKVSLGRRDPLPDGAA